MILKKYFQLKTDYCIFPGKSLDICVPKKHLRIFTLQLNLNGEKRKYPPRDADTTKRDNGICYYFSSDAKDTVWPKSIECQIQEGDTGDFWLISGVTIKVNGIRSQPDSFTRVKKRIDGEMPTGQWNRVEVIANKGKITYIVNGKIVNEGEEPSLTEGKILYNRKERRFITGK